MLCQDMYCKKVFGIWLALDDDILVTSFLNVLIKDVQ